MRGSDFIKASFERGRLNKITDVRGVKVGHSNVVRGSVKTGITVILPHSGCLYEERVFGARFVLNGYGKATGFVQLDELGLIETPIVLTGTMNVGQVWDNVKRYVVERAKARSVNPIILECNDTRMGENENAEIGYEDFLRALENAEEDFELGCVGAGVGMVTFGYKSGIGSSSRIVGEYTLGVLALPNFGRREDIGSVVVVVATDAPLIPNQLRRLAVRAMSAVVRVGGRVHHGSGDMAIAFSTAARLPRKGSVRLDYIPDDSEVFKDLLVASMEASYEALVDSLANGCDEIGRNGREYRKMNEDEIRRLVENHSW